MDVKKINSKLAEIFSEYTMVKAFVSKKVQEEQYEPYTISYEQTMVVLIDEKDEALSTMTQELDDLIVQEFRNRGVELDPEAGAE